MSEEQLTFEEALARLEETVRLLEEGNLPLEEAIAGYEQGVRLVRFLQAQLNKAEGKIRLLVEEEEGFKLSEFRLQEGDAK